MREWGNDLCAEPWVTCPTEAVAAYCQLLEDALVLDIELVEERAKNLSMRIFRDFPVHRVAAVKGCVVVKSFEKFGGAFGDSEHRER